MKLRLDNLIKIDQTLMRVNIAEAMLNYYGVVIIRQYMLFLLRTNKLDS